MSQEAFAAVIGASLAANGLTLFFLWALWQMSKAEKEGRRTDRMPWKVYAAGIIPPVIGAVCIGLFVF